MPLLNIERARELMKRRGLGALIGTTPEHVEYLSGFHSHGQSVMPSVQVAVVLPSDESSPLTLVVPQAELDVLAQTGLSVPSVVPYGRFFVVEQEPQDERLELEWRRLSALRRLPTSGTFVEGLVTALKGLGLERSNLGLDAAGIRPQFRTRLAEALPGATLEDGYALIQEVRMVKTAEEVALLREAVRITEVGMLATIDSFAEGASETDLTATYEAAVLREGGRPTFSVIALGRRSALSNGLPDASARLGPGDLVRFDVGCSFHSYKSDISRMASLGEPESKAIDYYRAVVAGEAAALAAVRPGVSASEIFEVAVRETRAAGIPHYERHHVGHGIGIEVYDPPTLSPGVDIPLETGMVLNIETPYYESGWGGVQIEDTIVVTDHGHESLMSLGRELVIV